MKYKNLLGSNAAYRAEDFDAADSIPAEDPDSYLPASTPRVPSDVADMISLGYLREAIDRLIGPPAPDDLPTINTGKRRPGRPRGRNYTKISITVDEDLLNRLDRHAADRGGQARSAAIRDVLDKGLDA